MCTKLVSLIENGRVLVLWVKAWAVRSVQLALLEKKINRHLNICDK